MWWLTYNDNTCTSGRCTSPDDGRLRPKHVEWLCRNKTCTVLHQVGVSFDLYYDARKHKIKTTVCVAHCPLLYFVCCTRSLGTCFCSRRYVVICYCEMCTFLSIHNVVLWVVTPYRLLGGNRCFGGTCIFTLHVEVKWGCARLQVPCKEFHY